MNKRNYVEAAQEALRRQALALIRRDDDASIHRWLCHPDRRCEDGCTAREIPERREAYEDAMGIFDDR